MLATGLGAEAVCMMLGFSVILRVLACSLPYTSLMMRMVYTPLTW